MSGDLISTLRAIVRDELAQFRLPALGIVTRVLPRADDGSDDNHQINVRLRDSGLELQRVPYAVSRIGWSCLPREGELVLLAFIGGDLNAPVALGSVYDDTARPPPAGPEEVVYQPPVDEASDVRRLHVELPNGALLTVEDAAVTVTAGDTVVTVSTDGDVEITAAGNLKLVAKGDISLDADGKIALTAKGDVAISATGQATVEGTAGATVKGAQVKLAGITQFSPS